MAHLKKRGRYYSIRFSYTQEGEKIIVTKTLGTRHKDVAQKMLRELEQLEALGKIDPLQPGFNPKKILMAEEKKGEVQCSTVQEALDLFYQAKQHLSPASVDAYKRALDHFVDLNGLNDEHPRNITVRHFETIIFKKGIKTATRHYYFRHLRTWWRFLKKRKIVKQNHFEFLKEDLPTIRENTRPKMISEDELNLLFKTFDKELKRKQKLPEFEPDKVQHWFKPMIALYFLWWPSQA